MALIIAKMMAFVGAIGDHFIVGNAYFTRDATNEWVYQGSFVPSVKANNLGAAIADILLWGAILVDQIIQTLVAPASV